MQTVRETPAFVTQINHIKVAPEHSAELIDKMLHQLDTVIARAPGFLSSSIHRSEDGRNVVNYVQFETAAQLDAVHAAEAFKAQFETYRHLVLEGGPNLYEVVRVRTLEQESSAVVQ